MIERNCPDCKENISAGNRLFINGYPNKLEVVKVEADRVWFHRPANIPIEVFTDLGYEATGLIVFATKSKITSSPARSLRSSNLNPYALILYDMGYNLIPISNDPNWYKKPELDTWKDWQTKRVPLELMRFWMEPKIIYLDYGGEAPEQRLVYRDFALILGPISYSPARPLVCLDADDLEAEELALLRCPPTSVMSVNNKGFHHRVWGRPEGLCPMHTKITVNGRKYNLDIKSDGGYFIIPGSLNKKAVEPWTQSLIASCPVFEPEWLPRGDVPSTNGNSHLPVEELPRVYSDPEQKLRMESFRKRLRHSPGAKEGQGADNYCFALANAAVHEYGLGEEDAIEVMLEWGAGDDQLDKYGSPYGWEFKQIQHKVRDALKQSPRKKRLTADVLEARRIDHIQDVVVGSFEIPEDDPDPTPPTDPAAIADNTKDKPKRCLLLKPSQARRLSDGENNAPYWGGIQMGMSVLLTGLPNSGKTRVVHSMIVETARRSSILWGHDLTPCHYLSIDPENRLKNTIKYFDDALGNQTDIEDIITFVDKDSLPDPLTVEFIQECVEALRQRINDQPLVVTIDTIRACYSGDPKYDERNEAYVRNILKPIKTFANDSGNIIMSLHHHGWATNRSSGSADWWGAVDGIFEYHRPDKSPIGKLERIRVRGNDSYQYDTLMLKLDENNVLRAITKNEAVATDPVNEYTEANLASDYIRFKSLIPEDEEHALPKGDVETEAREGGFTQKIAREFMAKGIEDGEFLTKKGPYPSILIWRK